MRHLWFLNHYANPPGFPGGARHHSLAKYLPEYGWRTTLIVSSVVHHSEHQLLADGVGHALETVDGVEYLRLRVPPIMGNSGGRLLNWAAYCARALDPRSRRLLAPPDVVIGSSVHPFAALTGSLLARRYGVPFDFEVRDLWPETLIARGRLDEESRMAGAFRMLERHLYRQATYTITLLPQAHEYIRRYGIPEERVVWIPNGVDWGSSYAEPLPRPSKKSFDFMYFGAHSISNDLDIVLDAFHRFQQRYEGRRPVRLRLIGDGPSKPEFMDHAREIGVQNVSFENPIPREQVPALAAQADAFVVVLRDVGRLYRYGISLNKLYEYLAAGRPVISALRAGNDPVAESGAGFSIPPDVGAMAEAMGKMVGLHHATRARMGRAGRRFMAENHDYRLLAGKLARVLDASIGERSGS